MPQPIMTGKPLRILIIEDEYLIADMLGEILEEMGHAVCGMAATQAEAVEQAAAAKPDLIIADARLHEGSGIAAVQVICAVNFVPHIFVSGDVASVRLQSPNALILKKPFQEAELVRAIEMVMGSTAPV